VYPVVLEPETRHPAGIEGAGAPDVFERDRLLGCEACREDKPQGGGEGQQAGEGGVHRWNVFDGRKYGSDGVTFGKS